MSCLRQLGSGASLSRRFGLLMLGMALLGACARVPASGTENLGRSLAAKVAPAVPRGFLWGVSTAGYQWEGYDTTSQWAAFDRAGRTAERNPKGADGLNRYAEDLDLTKGLGCNAFRTSIEWSRIEPEEGRYDPVAVAHYHRVLNAMSARGIEPLVTLMHFSYPAWLDKYGGWESKEAPKAFARFASFVGREYGSKVKWYITFNEPNVFLIAGWLSPMFPPGKTDPVAGLRAMRRMIDGHSLAYDALHQADADAQVSFNMYTAQWALGAPTPPLSAKDAADIEKYAEHEVCSDTSFFDELQKRGKKLDYAALDYYCKFRLYLPFVFPRPDTWEVYPEGIYNALKRYHKRYNLPILIAENGMATRDLAQRQDRWTRSAYLVSHIQQMQRAMAEGVPVMGYVHWSITDNYEWGSFSPRFGLFSVDCRNQNFRRVRADGATAFEDVIRTKGVNELLLRRYPAPSPLELPKPWLGGGQGLPVSIYR
ncbi:MAG: glycoside hydrolase family 1 protein [Candidatus Sericytochromatia bacterium]|nr:glycoside hydrolase family 1 protein [Candidatus Sericytochromatia bacterium]